MSGGPSPDDFRAKVFRDREHTGDWRVEKLCEDGESIEVAIFSGRDARLRAIRYADREYGEFDEFEPEPYQRSPEAKSLIRPGSRGLSLVPMPPFPWHIKSACPDS
jgi:hypothetical protein